MWKAAESLLNIYSVGRLDLTQGYSRRRCKFMIVCEFSPPHVWLFPILHHYYSHSKGSYSRLHPIWAGIGTFILAEFNYVSSLLPFSLALIHPKTLKQLLSFFITMSWYHKSEPMFISHHVQLDCARGRRGETDISDINHRLVHRSAHPRTQHLVESNG